MEHRCPKCNERTVLMQDSRNETDYYYVCHDCKWVGRKTEVYSRCCGYLRPTDGWNKGKKQEFSERKMYSLEKANKKVKEEKVK